MSGRQPRAWGLPGFFPRPSLVLTAADATTPSPDATSAQIPPLLMACSLHAPPPTVPPLPAAPRAPPPSLVFSLASPPALRQPASSLVFSLVSTCFLTRFPTASTRPLLRPSRPSAQLCYRTPHPRPMMLPLVAPSSCAGHGTPTLPGLAGGSTSHLSSTATRRCSPPLNVHVLLTSPLPSSPPVLGSRNVWSSMPSSDSLSIPLIRSLVSRAMPPT